MLKKIFALAAVAVALVACGGGNAHAQDLYRVSPNSAIGTGEILKLQKQPNGYLTATTVSGQVFQSYVYDPSGVIVAKAQADHPKWILNGYTLYAMNKAVTAICTSQGTAIYWPYSPVPEVVNDGCQIAYQNAVNGTTTYN